VVAATLAPPLPHRSTLESESTAKLMGLAILGEKVAAKIYVMMGQLRPEYKDIMRKFATMEGKHGTWFSEVSLQNNIEPDRAFAENEMGYLLSQVDEHFAANDFDALAVVQGFIVESMAIATYEPFLKIAHKYPGSREVFQKALDEEHYHVEWITRYLRLRFYDATEEFTALAQRVNVQGVDCIGGSMMNIAEYLDVIGLSGADCAGVMMDEYTGLLERVGVPTKAASKNVISLFMPLIRKYRHGEKTK
jgi:rubrerythrin